MLSNLIIAMLFLSGLSGTLLIGVAATFAAIYLPTLLLLDLMPTLTMARLPDLSASYAVVAGMAIGLLFTPADERQIRWNLLDAVIVLLGVAAMVTAVTTEVFYTGVNVFFEQALGFVLPYMLARIAFGTPAGRKWMLLGGSVCAILVAIFALIEMRLYPHFYRSIFETFGLYPTNVPRMAYRRSFLGLQFFRAESAFQHPIFLGNGCLGLTGLMVILALATPRGLRQPSAWIGAAAAFVGMIASISFSPYNGFLIGCMIFLSLHLTRLARSLAPLIPIAMIVAGMAYTTYVAVNPLPPRPPQGSSLANSTWIRKLIIKNTADLFATAGPFGHGKRVTLADVDLKSVDNTYVLFGMTRGWVYLALWLAIPTVLGFQVRRGYRAAFTRRHAMMMSVGFATTLAVMVAMYTVWAGWAGNQYTLVWLIVVACTSTASTMLGEANPHPELAHEPAGYVLGEAA